MQLRKKFAVAVAVTATLGIGATAFAFWTSGGSGSGTGVTGSAANVTISGNLAEGVALVPGVTVPLTLHLSNPNPYDVDVSAITISFTVDDVDDASVCGISVTPPSGTALVRAGADGADVEASVTMANTDSPDQNTCQSRVVRFTYGASAVSKSAVPG